MTQIKRGDDNTFKCACEKVFKHPLLLKKHMKECNGESTCLDDGLIDDNMLGEEDDLDASELSESADDNHMDDTPADCIGMMSKRHN
ncbi:MAG TPA: hypothetical protein VGR84_06670 [Candidatus Acidoferrales bacterium]|nr:hypothetical protein [Candidatus Acidoferrales bacterium]